MESIDIIKNYLRKSKYLNHAPKRNTLIRFLLLISILIIYFIYISLQYGIGNGFMIGILTWSVFVLCTPIADAGFLLDFPIRLLTKIRMIYSEIVVWTFAILMNLYFLTFNPMIYEKTGILQLFKLILLNPFPFWIIIFISAIGTFLSLYFADEMIDVSKHIHRKKYLKYKNKYRFILIVLIIISILMIYNAILSYIGINQLNLLF
ncbi:MAG: hypothetical protein GOV02_04055 [Candidatus Aenigmarchaeota archaeon]|nr:hypothetical protein [Candidatus Aenigmarchaeota archaeon]